MADNWSTASADTAGVCGGKEQTMRIIDADEFERCLQNYRPYVDSGRFNAIQTEINQVLDCIEYEIEDAPSIDIVRCGECRRVREDGGHANCGGYLYCRKWKTLVDEDGYCSWGEREGE